MKDIELLSLFHGSRRPDDGLEHDLGLYGAKLHCFDMEIDGAHDLADQRRWDEIIHDIEQERYDGGGGGAPCSTFSAGRNNNDGRPRPLRGEWPPTLFGLANLNPDEKEQVRLGTLLALRKAHMCSLMYQQHRPFWAETPARRDGSPSVFKLPEY